MERVVLNNHAALENARFEGLGIINRLLEQGTDNFDVVNISNCRVMTAEVKPNKTTERYTEIVIKLRKYL